jgi:hypothetical protein
MLKSKLLLIIVALALCGSPALSKPSSTNSGNVTGHSTSNHGMDR